MADFLDAEATFPLKVLLLLLVLVGMIPGVFATIQSDSCMLSDESSRNKLFQIRFPDDMCVREREWGKKIFFY